MMTAIDSLKRLLCIAESETNPEDTLISLNVPVDIVREIISAQPEPKTGHWIADEVQLPDRVVLNYHCSVCGRKLVGYSTETLKDAPYCHCGAKMEVEHESDRR